MEWISSILAVIIVIFFIGSPAFFAYYNNLVVKKDSFHDKAVVYLCAELSHQPEKWQHYKCKITSNDCTIIRVPLKAVWRGVVEPIGLKIGIFTGILFSVAVFLALFTNLLSSFLRNVGFINFNISYNMLLIAVVLSWFFYYFRSIASVSNNVANKEIETRNYLNELGFANLEYDMLDALINQLRVDYDLFRKDSGLGGLVLLIVSAGALYYLRFQQKLSFLIEYDSLIAILLSIHMGKWLYEGYRTRIIYIALNALYEIKKVKIIGHRNNLTIN